MTSTLLAHGTIVQLSKSNASSKTTSGQWCVCILDQDSATPWMEGTFQVFNQKEEAEAYLAVHDEWLLDTSNSTPPPSPERMDGFVVSLSRKKADLHHLSANWTEWCTSSITPPIDQYVGRHIQILVKNGDVRSSVTTLIDSKDGDVYRLTYVDPDGDEIELSMQASALKEWVKRRPDALQSDKRPPAGTSSGAGSTPAPPIIGYPIKVITGDLPFAFDIIKKLTVSANLEADTLDAHEALAVLVARHSPRATTDYAKVLLTHPGADADDVLGGPIDRHHHRRPHCPQSGARQALQRPGAATPLALRLVQEARRGDRVGLHTQRLHPAAATPTLRRPQVEGGQLRRVDHLPRRPVDDHRRSASSCLRPVQAKRRLHHVGHA